MAYDRSASNLFNPLLAWADLGMRAAEMTVASSQNIGDAVDRMTRAGASPADAPVTAATTYAVPATAPAARPSTLGQVSMLQRTVFELMTQSWVRWMSALGTIASIPAGVGLARTIAQRPNPLEAVRTSLRPAGWGEKPATERQVGSLTYASQRKGRNATGDLQHAMASGEAKPRRKAATKRKGARRTARKSA